MNTVASCMYCGRPIAPGSGIMLGNFFYHKECTEPPPSRWQQPWTPYPCKESTMFAPLTEDDVRRIVREELDKCGMA